PAWPATSAYSDSPRMRGTLAEARNALPVAGGRCWVYRAAAPRTGLTAAAAVVLVLKRTVGSLWLGMAAGCPRTRAGLTAPECGPALAALSAGTTSAGAFGVAGPEPARAPAAPRAGVAPRACALGIALPRGGAGGGAGAAEGAGAGGAAAGAGVGEA